MIWSVEVEIGLEEVPGQFGLTRLFVGQNEGNRRGYQRRSQVSMQPRDVARRVVVIAGGAKLSR